MLDRNSKCYDLKFSQAFFLDTACQESFLEDANYKVRTCERIVVTALKSRSNVNEVSTR